jgi:hypothetical protein
MEPFGLFDLLKTLLPTPQDTENPSPAKPSAAEREKASGNPLPSPQQEPNNACLDFISRHDAHAKRLKKTDR